MQEVEEEEESVEERYRKMSKHEKLALTDDRTRRGCSLHPAKKI